MQFNFSRVHYQILLVGIIIGMVTGGVISAFRVSIQFLFRQVRLIDTTSLHHPWELILMLSVNLLIGLLIDELIRQRPSIQGSGIPQTEAAILNRGHYPWWSTLWWKFIASTLAIGSGAFMGDEGPSIQIGGSIGHGVASWEHSNRDKTRLMIAGGAAAGLSAVFNTPIASCLFVLETVYRSFSMSAVMMTLSAAITADCVSSSIFGELPFLYISKVPALPLHLGVYLLGLGILIGILSRFYKFVTLASSRWYGKVAHWLPSRFKLCVPLLLVVPIGIYFPRLIGSGINLVHLSINRSLPIWLISGYLIFKFMFSSVSFGSGLPGGILLPILTFGALIGAVYARSVSLSLNFPVGYRVTLIVTAMAGFFAAVIDAPFTSIILLTEMVGSLHHLVALAIVVLVACAVDNLLDGRPIYHVLLTRLVENTSSSYHPEPNRN